MVLENLEVRLVLGCDVLLREGNQVCPDGCRPGAVVPPRSLMPLFRGLAGGRGRQRCFLLPPHGERMLMSLP